MATGIPDLSAMNDPAPKAPFPMSLEQDMIPGYGAFLENHRALDSGLRGKYITAVVHLATQGPPAQAERKVFGISVTVRSDVVVGAWIVDHVVYLETIEKISRGEHPGPVGVTGMIPMSNVAFIELPEQPTPKAPEGD